jgi:aryl-alcohol dehydrogenase-like predicted oxidoreductase
MQYRKFGNTDLMVSEIGFGAWAIGGGAMIGNTAIGWGDAHDKTSTAAVHQALNSGINFFDTADIYGLGHSEKLLGKILGKQKDIIIASKGGNVSRQNQFTIDYCKQYIIEACEQSLVRLQRDYIDYYQLHTARLVHLQQGDCIEAMQQLQQQGKIRYWGISLNTFEPAPEADFFMQQNIGSGFQLVLNILNQIALPLLKTAATKGYGIIARMPLQFGLLTGKFDNGVSFPDNDHRKNRLTSEVVTAAQNALQPVWELCKKYQVTKTQLALSYILSYPQVSTIIPGIRTAGHALSNTQRLIKLAVEDITLIEELGLHEFGKMLDLIKKQG